EVPGFVVNRVLNSAASEIWRYKDETGRSAPEIDKEIAEARVTPMGPFFLSDLLGLDTVLHVAEHLERSYGDRFYVSPEMREHFAPPTILRRLVAQGRLGKKSGQGFFPYPQADPGFEQKETVLLETRGPVAVIWLNRPPANPLSPALISEFGELWKHCHVSDE